MLQSVKPIGVVVDDHLLFAESFASILERLGLFRLVRVFNSEAEYRKFLIHHFDKSIYVFMDYYLPETNALPLISETKRLNKKAQIIIISSVVNPAIVSNILSYQPQGFLSKTSGMDTVLNCLQTLAKGQQYLCPVIKEILTLESSNREEIPFTARELEMLYFFSMGMSIAQTAEQTNLSKHTIVSHRRKMMNKINAKSITELLAHARRSGLI